MAAGLLLFAAIFGALIGTDTTKARAIAQSVSRLWRSAPAGVQPTDPTEKGTTTLPAAPLASARAALAPEPMPGPWRVSQLSSTPDVKLVEGTMDRRSLIDTLKDSGVPTTQIFRLLNAFNGIRKFDKTRRHESFVVALDIASQRVRAFEYQAGPTEIYQARETAGGSLVGERLDLHVEKKRASAAVVVGDDLSVSLQASGLDPSLIDLLDDALEGRAQMSHLHPGSRLRIVADYETALGMFARYLEVAAIEYLSADPEAPSLRVYRFHGGKSPGYFDSKGRQPYKGGFRRPIPFARISSGFNLHRLHPILKVVMPHNGVDFVANLGTPVYAACHGTIESVGDSGPSGNLVTIRHAGGITTGYAHLSRFALRLSPGQAVETRQLVGYVGSTGRSTGAHLHFSAKKNGVFMDPLNLKLDGDRVLPRAERDAFDEERVSLDRLLDAIPLPSAPLPTTIRPDSADGEDLEPPEEIHR